MTDVARDNNEIYEYCRQAGHDDFLERAEESIRFWALDQWDARTRAYLQKAGRPFLTISEFTRVTNTVLGEMTRNSLDIKFVPIEGDGEAADAIDKVYLSIARDNKLALVDEVVRRDAWLTGRGFYNVRVDFDKNMRGHVNLEHERPQNVVLDPDITTVDTSKWPRVIVAPYVSFNDVAMAHGEAKAKQLREAYSAEWIDYHDRPTIHGNNGTPYWRSGTNFEDKNIKQYRMIDHQFIEIRSKEFFIDPETGDAEEVPESWSRNKIAYVIEQYGYTVRKRRAPTIRWQVSCGDLELHDEDSPYKFFTIVPCIPYLIDGHTFSSADMLKDPQLLYNKALSQELHILNTSANSGYKYKTGTLVNMTRDDIEQRGGENGIVFELTDMEGLEKITPNQPPSGHDNLGRKAQAAIYTMSGASEAQLNMADNGMTNKRLMHEIGGDQASLALFKSACFTAKSQLAERVLDCVQAYYTEERVVRITRDNLTADQEIVTINQSTPEGRIVNDVTTGRYAVTIMPTAARNTLDESAFDQLVTMRTELGIQIPDSALIAASVVQKKAELIAAVREAQGGDQSPEQAQIAQLQIALAQAELATEQAKARAADAQGQLSLARAGRAVADTEFDGRREAAETNRLRAQNDYDIQQRQLENQQLDRQTKAALELTKLGTQVKIAKNKPTPKTPATPKKRKP